MSRSKESVMDSEKLQWAIVIVGALTVFIGSGVMIMNLLPQL